MLEKIFYQNFLSRVGSLKKVDLTLLKDEIKKEKERISFLASYYNFLPDYKYIDDINKKITIKEKP